MGIRIFEQPDGQFAVYSSIVEDFIVEDATADEVREWYVEREKEKAREKVEDMLHNAEEGGYVGRGPENFEEAVERAERH